MAIHLKDELLKYYNASMTIDAYSGIKQTSFITTTVVNDCYFHAHALQTRSYNDS